MKKKNMSNKLRTEIEELRNTRKSIDEYYFNFLKNIGQQAKFMHDAIKIRPETKFLLTPMSQYITSMVSCWETFFRDVFVFIAKEDVQFRNSIFSLGKVKKETRLMLENDLVEAEYLSKLFNFQNWDDIENAFSPIFNGELFKSLGDFAIPLILINGKIYGEVKLGAIDTAWIDITKKVFHERHKIIHDANYAPCFKMEFMQKAEYTFITVPQIFTLWISTKYQFRHIMASIEFQGEIVSLPTLVTITDIISEDWIVVQ